MSLIPLIIDSGISYGIGSPGPCSLLTLPLGTGTVLNQLIDGLRRTAQSEILLLSDSSKDDHDSLQRLGPAQLNLRVVSEEQLHRELDRYEASDYLLVVDPRLWPLGGHDFSACPALTESYRGATHVIAVGSSVEGTRERVECDSTGNVRRVQRLYASKNYAEVGSSAITHSVVPVRAVIGSRFRIPHELRVRIAGMGILSQDQPRRVDVSNLGSEVGFLALTEHTIARLCREPLIEGFQFKGPNVLVGEGCQIHPSARLVGPLLLQKDVIIEEGVTVLGPAVVGEGSRIMAGASIIHSAVGGGSLIHAGTTLRQRVACGVCSGAGQEVNPLPGALPGTALLVDTVRGLSQKSSWRTVRPSRGRWLHFALKRSLDVVMSALALVALSPLLGLVSLLIKWDSPGPVLFAHRREGRKGRDFPCWKFRTMVQDAHQQQRKLYKQSEVDGPQFKIRNDPRVTRVGHWLRGTNIDELPQLINVLCGHMSLVGPRPSPFRENQICIPWRRARLSVRPGITGLWQVCRDENRMNGDFHEWIFYDLTYVRHLSIWLDLKILAMTVLTAGGRWSVPLAWLLPGVSRGAEAQEYSVSTA